jgi:MioC protein
MKVKVLIGTMTGTAEMTAQAIEMDCGDLAEFELQLMDHLGAEAFENADTLHLICTSTYGQGDVPDNAKAFYDTLCHTKPNLSHVRYGVVALGDTTYLPTYAFGGKKFDAILQELGAQRVGEIFIHNASSGTLPEMEASTWARPWLEQAIAELQAA